jgi:hypothetical protein
MPVEDGEFSTTYTKVKWHDDGRDHPTLLYAELDTDRWEIRKVEVYADGRIDFADADRSTGSTWLGEKVTPSVEEINSYEPFEASVISPAEFEEIWMRALARHPDQ